MWGSRFLGCWLALVPACAPEAATTPPPSPPPAVAPLDRPALNRRCAGCHTAIARTWQTSLHRASHDNDAYQRAFKLEPLPFCTGCHAPEADPQAPEPELAALGVACTSCHDIDAAESGAHQRVPRRDPTPAGACARCHEFSFPNGEGSMQMTVSEHRRSPFARVSCQSCHMPRSSAGVVDHRFAASRDPAFLRRAVRVEAVRDADQLVVTLRRGEVGHAFPTGDLFRRLRLTVEPLGGDAGEAQEILLGRRTKLGPEADNRAFVQGDVVLLRVPVNGGALRWQLAYERVQHPLVADESQVEVAASIEVASGIVP